MRQLTAFTAVSVFKIALVRVSYLQYNKSRRDNYHVYRNLPSASGSLRIYQELTTTTKIAFSLRGAVPDPINILPTSYNCLIRRVPSAASGLATASENFASVILQLRS